MMLALLFSLKSMETLDNGVQPDSGASLQSCRSIDADTWCKRAFNVHAKQPQRSKKKIPFHSV